jgi:DUF1680 family protein
MADTPMPTARAAGYSGTPLPKKLGIKAGSTLRLVNAPKDFWSTLGAMPKDLIMKNAIAVIIAAVVVVASAPSVHTQTPPPAGYPIQAVPMTQVKVTGGFWLPKLETNRTVSIPHILEQNETTGRVDNFRKAAGLMPGDYSGRRFNDTDIYKIVEAASYSLASHPDPALATQIDDLIVLIAKSQQPDGYLFPARTINPQKPAAGVGTERWQYENTGSHELYNAGHLYEAAVAHFMATGKRTLFDVAIKNADLVVKTFGPGRREDAPGHEIVEMALVRLYGATNDRKYLDEAKFFVDERGTDHHASENYTEQSWLMYNDRPYRQDDRPVVDQERAEGHAVRAMYLYSAVTDIAAWFKSAAYNTAIDRLWNDVVSKRIYITGGVGSTGGTESFGADYYLPNRQAYTETCASVGGLLWNHRMFLKSGDAKYLDAFEQTLYNGLLSGVSIKGDTFFYQNPLESTGQGSTAQRSAYFDVACCPANLARLIAQLPGLIYATKGNELYVNLYVDSEADVKIGGAMVHIKQTTNYPWDGRSSFSLTADAPIEFALKLRVPGWIAGAPLASDLYTFAQPDQRLQRLNAPNGFGTATMAWPGVGTQTSTPGWYSFKNITISKSAATSHTPARAEVNLTMPVRRVLAHEGVKDDVGKAAIQRGPLVYVLEGVDNGGKVLDLSLPMDAALTPVSKPDLLGGITVLTGTAVRTNSDGTTVQVPITAIPYYAWANRGRGEMAVWIKR